MKYNIEYVASCYIGRRMETRKIPIRVTMR